MVKHMMRRGDTLIEVMLAVGIFCMVAVAVVAVMSGGTSSSQTALETTLTREEIDSQAEALRFIHRSYIADKKVGASSPFGQLWQNITALAIPGDADHATERKAVIQFQPGSCQEDLYADGKEVSEHGFIINTKNLATLGILNQEDRFNYNTNYNNAIQTVLYSKNLDKMKTAATYPRLVYQGTENTDTLIEQTNDMKQSSTATTNEQLYRAEGIYIVGVADPGTSIAGELKAQTAYYDFYIRTCWYGTGDQAPSTISTVIRLYNPDITSS